MGLTSFKLMQISACPLADAQQAVCILLKRLLVAEGLQQPLMLIKQAEGLMAGILAAGCLTLCACHQQAQ